MTAAGAQAQARTYPIGDHNSDRGFEPSHVYGEYEEVAYYVDPDFQEGSRMESPLYNPLYVSYDIVIVINKSSQVINEELVEPAQIMRVYVREEAMARLNMRSIQNINYNPATGLVFYWKISTARPGKKTPSGHFRVQSFSSDHRSSLYHNSPMPYAVFFNDNIASHGVDPIYYRKLGEEASAGCVRLETQRAKDLFHMIASVGRGVVDQLSSSGSPTGRKLEAYKSIYVIRD